MTISLDLHATTPTAPQVIAAMAPYWDEQAWNAHSAHAGGAVAAQAVAMARAQVAGLIGAMPGEVYFTAGATEANNIALLGLSSAARSNAPTRRRILTSAIEHKCVLECAKHLSVNGFGHELIPVGNNGIVDLTALEAMLDEQVLLVAVMAANNEVGTCQPLAAVAELCARHGALFHVDAAQAVGRVPFDVMTAGCDTASLSGHKFYGPKGIGALYVSAAAAMRPEPIMFGGGQESALRPGTLPVPLIVGMGAAAALAGERMGQGPRLTQLAALFHAELGRLGVKAVINSADAPRLPGSLNFRIAGVDAEHIVQRLAADLHLSTGSACQSGQLMGSYVLAAMGCSPEEIASSFRVCFGHDHREDDARVAASLLAETVKACQNRTGQDVQ
jgi:cysteine desulfurase